MENDSEEFPKDAIYAPCLQCGQSVEGAVEKHWDAKMRASLINIFKEHALHPECRAARRAKVAEVEESERLVIAARDFKRLICPADCQNTRPHELPLPHRYAEVMSWEFGPKGLMAFGKTGRGKSRSVYCLLEREHGEGRSVIAISHLDFDAKVVKLCPNGNPNLDFFRWIRAMIEVDILLIDDLGKVKFRTGSGEGRASEQHLYHVVIKRIENERPVFITSEHNGASLEATMSQERGPAFVRRIREHCLDISFKE